MQIKHVFLIITLVLLSAAVPIRTWGVMAVSADAAVLMDASTGQVLYEKNAYQPRPPASTTKVLTALIAIENISMGEKVVIGTRPTRLGGSVLGIRQQQVYSMEDLLKAALICSANDASLAIGEYVGGDEETFLQIMNKKALLLGARTCCFKNTNGLPADGHCASAYDLAIIARYALHQPQFAAIVKTVRTRLDSQQTINNTNRLLESYPGANGVKTGTTNAAGQCLIASATRAGRQLISVVLHSDNRFTDSARLLDYGFQNWMVSPRLPAGEVVAVLPVRDGEPKTVEIVLESQVGAAIPKSRETTEIQLVFDQLMMEPMPAGSRVGEAVLIWKGEAVQKVRLLTKQGSKKKTKWNNLPILKEF